MFKFMTWYSHDREIKEAHRQDVFHQNYDIIDGCIQDVFRQNYDIIDGCIQRIDMMLVGRHTLSAAI